MQMIKQLGQWRSDAIAQGYIKNSLYNRQLIFEGVTQQVTKNLLNALTCAPNNFLPPKNSETLNSITFNNTLSSSSTSPIAILPNNNYAGLPNISNNSSNTGHSEPSTNAHETSYVITKIPSATDSNINLDWADFAEEFEISNVNNNAGN